MIWYLPLEPYRERYTEQLTDWTVAALRRRNITHTVVRGIDKQARINTGQVLDAYQRCSYALTQMNALVEHARWIDPSDWLLFDDLFTPGYESLPYIFDQTGKWPKICVRNWAQSMDVDDFTFPMLRWMRHYEHMVDRTATLVLVASTCHKEMWEAAGFGPAHVVGLPFDSAQVSEQCDERPFWDRRPRRVVYSSRLDREKQPHFFMDVIERAWDGRNEVEFVLCTGASELRSNDPTVIPRMTELINKDLLRVETGLTKAEYYAILANARVQLNTARQDFVSFTALEASTFGTPTLAPAFRSFPEALENRRTQLYIPWSVEDCWQSLATLLTIGESACGRLAAYHDGTLDRTLDLMERS